MNHFAWLHFLCWCILLGGSVRLVRSSAIHQVPLSDGTVGAIQREKRLFKSPQVNRKKRTKHYHE
jgi:hypothetical protein